MKKVMAILLAAVCFVVTVFMLRPAKEVQTKSEKALLVEEYLKREYSINCEVVQVKFQHYDYGITGGLYMYSFECKDDDNNLFIVTYRSYFDLDENTLEKLDFDAYMEKN